MYSAISANKRNTVIIMAVFLVIIAGLGWLAGAAYNNVGITWIVIAVASVYALIQYFAASRLALAVNGAHQIEKRDAPELYRIVENLAITDGLPMPKVYIMDDPAPNAFATGRNPDNASVAVTTGLLQIMDKRELAAVLAHEMGHAMHSYLSTKNQEPVDREYVIFVAEVASTCNESLLMQHLLKKTQDKKTRAYLINYFLEQFRTTLYRQTMFAEFELKINELVQNGGSLTAEGLNKIYHDLNVFYYGDAVVVDDLIDREWARIPHFYYNYYVFQYSTGFSAAMALSERILSEGEPAVKDYLNFLSGGCSKDPISLLQGAGVDMRTAEPVHRALKLFDSLLDEMEALMEA